MCNKSESIANLAKSLVAFNGEVGKIGKEATNPFFNSKYASLDNIVNEIRPILQKHGLSVIQLPGGDGEKVIMKTMLVHESGEWIESEPLVMKPTKTDPQGMGSCITYARRYSLSGFLSLNTGEDDDGSQASQPQGEQKPAQNQKQHEINHDSSQNEDLAAIERESQANRNQPSVEYVSDGQSKMLFAKWKSSKYANSKEDCLELISAQLAKRVADFKLVEKADVNKVIKWLDENKAA